MALAKVQLVRKPHRWDQPFSGRALPDEVVSDLLRLPVLRTLCARDFPSDLALPEIIANESRFRRFQPGETLYAQGDPAASIFIVLDGGVIFARAGSDSESLDGNREPNRTAPIRSGRLSQFDMFGEVDTLRRAMRGETMTADANGALVLEMRRSGLRDLMHWSDGFRAQVMQSYCTRALEAGLDNCRFSQGLPDNVGRLVLESAQFRQYGEFGWSHRFQRDKRSMGSPSRLKQPGETIVEEGNYLDEFFVVCAGFASLGRRFGKGEQVLGLLQAGDDYGLELIVDAAGRGAQCQAQHAVRAVGYCDVIALPARLASIVRDHQRVLPQSTNPMWSPTDAPVIDDEDLRREFLIENRMTNGTQAMAIDLNRCIHCDECVRVCAATHGGVARFKRDGPVHRTMMVAHACMHCTDAVCLNDCPTGAINRSADNGAVIVDESTCIGCSSCAAGCPYDNIRMEPAHNDSGAVLVVESGAQLLRPMKCDLCAGRAGGPACVEACASSALTRVRLSDLARPNGAACGGVH